MVFFVREVPPFPLWFYYTLPYVLEQGMKIHNDNTIQYNNTEKVHNMYNNTQDQLRAEAVLFLYIYIQNEYYIDILRYTTIYIFILYTYSSQAIKSFVWGPTPPPVFQPPLRFLLSASIDSSTLGLWDCSFCRAPRAPPTEIPPGRRRQGSPCC